MKPVMTPKLRIAERLSIGLPPTGCFLPTVGGASASAAVENRRASAADSGVNAFSLLGNKMELNCFSDTNDSEMTQSQQTKRFAC